MLLKIIILQYNKQQIVYKQDQNCIVLNHLQMLKKKNYKQEQHFSQLHTFYAYATGDSGNVRKVQVYYKRYRKQKQTENLYNLLYGNNDNIDKNAPGQKVQEQVNRKRMFTQDRTLQLISFDSNLAFLKKYLRKIGKIRFYQTGQGLYKGHKINTALCTFKFQFDLVKCFRDEYLQQKMNQSSLPVIHTQTAQSRLDQQCNLIQKYLPQQLKNKQDKLKELQAEGYQVVTDVYGQYKMDYQANKKFVQNLPQMKRKAKREAKQAKLRQQIQKQKQEEQQKQRQSKNKVKKQTIQPEQKQTQNKPLPKTKKYKFKD